MPGSPPVTRLRSSIPRSVPGSHRDRLPVGRDRCKDADQARAGRISRPVSSQTSRWQHSSSVSPASIFAAGQTPQPVIAALGKQNLVTLLIQDQGACTDAQICALADVIAIDDLRHDPILPINLAKVLNLRQVNYSPCAVTCLSSISPPQMSSALLAFGEGLGVGLRNIS